jgi:hypothetical protein
MPLSSPTHTDYATGLEIERRDMTAKHTSDDSMSHALAGGAGGSFDDQWRK